MATLPVTTATAERSFSTLRRLKTYLRNNMGETRLTGLALLNIYRNVDVNVEEIIDRFAMLPRKWDFILWFVFFFYIKYINCLIFFFYLYLKC